MVTTPTGPIPDARASCLIITGAPAAGKSTVSRLVAQRLSRNTLRSAEDQFFFDDYENLTAGMRSGFGDLGWWIDTSALTPDDTAEQIIANAGRLAAVDR